MATDKFDDKLVGGQKIKYLMKFFDPKGNMHHDISIYNLGQINKILDNLSDMELCNHLTSKHKSRFMCNKCYFDTGNN